MMKVNQLLMSFLLVFSFVVNNSLDGAQTPQTNFAKAMGFFKNLWAVARNRGTEEQERMYRATLAGIDFADSISGLLKEKEPSEFMQMFSFIFKDSPLSTTDVISNTIKTQAQKNLEAFVEWYIERQVQHFITEINPNNAPITEIQEKKIRAKEQFYRSAIEPAVRLLNGKSTRLEQLGLWIAKQFAKIIQKIRAFSGGEPIDTSWQATLQAEAKKAVRESQKMLEDWAKKKLDDAINSVKEAWNIVQQKTNDLANAITDAAKQKAREALESAQNNYMQLKESTEKALESAKEETKQKWNEALDFMKNSPSIVKQSMKNMAQKLKEYLLSDDAPISTIEAEKFFESSEFTLTDLENFLHEAIIEKIKNAQDEDYAKIIEDALDRFKIRLKNRDLSQEGIDIIFEALAKEIDYAVLRQMNPREFQKLTPELKTMVTIAWKNAPKKELLELSEEYYNFFPDEVLVKIKEALTETSKQQMDFDLINKLTALSLIEKSPLSDGIQLGQHNDAAQIAQKAADAQKQQAEQVAQHTTTTPTQTTPDKSSPTTNQDLPNFDNSRPRSDSIISTDSIYEDAVGSSLGTIEKEQAEKAQKEEEAIKKQQAESQKETLAKEKGSNTWTEWLLGGK